MKKSIFIAILAVFLLSAASFSLAKPPANAGKVEKAVYEAGGKIEVIIHAKDDSGLKTLSEVKRLGSGFYSMNISRSQLGYLEYSPHVEKVWLAREKRILLDVSVPIINASAGWNSGYNGSGIIICILDTGINKTHPSIAGRVVNESDFTGGNNPRDVNGHGTHVAGIAAGNDSTYRGVAFAASLLNAKVCNDAGSCPDSAILSGLDWCVDNGAHVLSLSLGGLVSPTDGSDALSAYLDAIVDKGKTVIVAAGNSGPGGNSDCRTTDSSGNSFSVCSPGLSHKAITVGSTDTGKGGTTVDAVSSFSSRGPTNDSRTKPDVLAPGRLVNSSNNNWETQDDFVQKSGTSMSTPHVAGLAALMLQARNTTPEEIKALLMNTAVDLAGNFSKANDKASGRINVSLVFQEINNTRKDALAASRAHNIFVPGNSSEIRATLYWPENYSVHNNLDLKLLDPGGDTINSSTSVFNTDERVRIQNPASGYWKILVIANLSSPQNYSIASNFLPSSQLLLSNDTINATSYHTLDATGITEINLDWNGSSNLDLFMFNSSGNLALSSAGSSNRENITANISGSMTIKITSNASVRYSITSNVSVSAKAVDTSTPQINLSEPLDGSAKASSNVTLNFTVSDNMNLEHSCSRSLNGTSVSLGNITAGRPFLSSVNSTDGSYTLNVTCTDQSGNNGSMQAVFTIDTARPVISFSAPSDLNNSFVPRNYTFINITANDTLTNIDTCTLEWNGTNQTMQKASNGSFVSCFLNKTDSDGTHNYRVYANDSAGNDASQTRNITFSTAAPVIISSAPPNNTAIRGLGNENFSLQFNETSLQRANLYWRNATGNFANASMTCATNCSVLVNLSAFAHNNTISFYFEAVDLAGNTANTSVFLSAIDRVLPDAVLSPPSPLNALINDSDAITVNITASEQLSAAVLEFNFTNESMSGSGTSWSKTRTNITDGNYTYKVYATDLAGNINITGNFSVVFNTTRNITSYFDAINSTVSGRNITVAFLETTGQNAALSSLQSFRNYTIRFNITGTVAEIINFSFPSLNISNIINTTSNISGIPNVTAAFNSSGGAFDRLVWVDVNSALQEGNYTGKVNFGSVYRIFFYLNGTKESPALERISSSCNSNLSNRPCFENANVSSVYLSSFSGAAAGNDTQKPEISVQSPSGSYSSSNISISYTATDNGQISSCVYRLNSGSNVTLANCTNTTAIAATGSNTLTLYANDTAGNENQSSSSFTFSPPAPASSGSSGGGGGGGSPAPKAATTNTTNISSIKMPLQQEKENISVVKKEENIKKEINQTEEKTAVPEDGKDYTIITVLLMIFVFAAYYLYYRKVGIHEKHRKISRKARHAVGASGNVTHEPTQPSRVFCRISQF